MPRGATATSTIRASQLGRLRVQLVVVSMGRIGLHAAVGVPVLIRIVVIQQVVIVVLVAMPKGAGRTTADG